MALNTHHARDRLEWLARRRTATRDDESSRCGRCSFPARRCGLTGTPRTGGNRRGSGAHALARAGSCSSIAGLANAFGQRPTTSEATYRTRPAQCLRPTQARSGLIYAARFRIDAHHELKNATLVLDPGWADGYTVNGLAPQPLTQGSRNGSSSSGSATSGWSPPHVLALSPGQPDEHRSPQTEREPLRRGPCCWRSSIDRSRCSR